VVFDAKVVLGTPGVNQTATPVRLVGYSVAEKNYWIATDRFDLTAEQVALCTSSAGILRSSLAGGNDISKSIICLPEAKTA
jgi:hypothetical protein